jgi:ATP-dependent Lhr-like helicase
VSILLLERPYSKEEVLTLLDPIVAEWFSSRFQDLTPPQRYAIPSIHEGKNTLIAAPTGSGKTLAAFLSIINELIALGKAGELKDQVYCVYVSPLRALNNDIYKNLFVPLREIGELAKQRNVELPAIRLAVRTGDTPSSERSRMLRHPPHLLITTPETLSIVLVAKKFRELLRGVRWVVVDEIHELCSSKRGTHLSLSLERLRELVGREFCRIGLSATIHPLDLVARFLVGYSDEGTSRGCYVVDARFVKPLDLLVDCPVEDLIHTSSEETSSALYSLIADLIKGHRTTLIFTNTRSGTERVVYHLQKLGAVDADKLAAHHSSLSRELRKDVEDRLKSGEMKVVVTSTSLELGIDIGSIDLVIQIGSPKSISRCLQRVGRSGHALDRVSRGRLIALERDDLVEDCVMAAEAYRSRLDKVYIPKAPLDVLAQHIVGMAVERKWKVREALRVIRRSYPYHQLDEKELRRVITYLAGGFKRLEDIKVYGKIWYDPSDDTFGRKGPMMRAIYASNVGTIPDEADVKVYLLKGRLVGTLEEEFLERLTPGDVFILGGRPYRFHYAKGMKAYVSPAEGEKPTIPSWFSELLPLSFELGEAIGAFRAKLFQLLAEDRPDEELLAYIMNECHATERAARAVLSYFKAEKLFLDKARIGAYPDNRTILVEDYRDERGRQNIIFLCTFGRRVNDALSRAYAYALASAYSVNVGVSVTDSGFALTLPPGAAIGPQWLLRQVTSDRLRPLLKEAIRHTEMVRRRFRHCATRSLMILRSYKGYEISLGKQQVNSQILMKLAEELDGFPVLEETFREVMEDVMDVENAKLVLRDIEWGLRRFHVTPPLDVPSPFTHEIILLGYSDIVLMEDRKRLLQYLHDAVMRRIGLGPL